jgi:hypothetical protein
VGEAFCEQHEVWGAIAAKSARMNASSPTGAARRLYAARREEVEEYANAMPVQPSQIGPAFALGGALTGIEIFDNETTFRKLAAKLARSYALDAIELGASAEPPPVETVRDFVEQVSSAPQERSNGVGIGEAVRLSTPEIVGAALEVDGHCVHLSAFRRDAAERSIRARRT